MDKARRLFKVAEFEDIDRKDDKVNEEGREGLLEMVYNGDSKKIKASDFQEKKIKGSSDGLSGFKSNTTSSDADSKTGLKITSAPTIQKTASQMIKEGKDLTKHRKKMAKKHGKIESVSCPQGMKGARILMQ